MSENPELHEGLQSMAKMPENRGALKRFAFEAASHILNKAGIIPPEKSETTPGSLVPESGKTMLVNRRTSIIFPDDKPFERDAQSDVDEIHAVLVNLPLFEQTWNRLTWPMYLAAYKKAYDMYLQRRDYGASRHAYLDNGDQLGNWASMTFQRDWVWQPTKPKRSLIKPATWKTVEPETKTLEKRVAPWVGTVKNGDLDAQYDISVDSVRINGVMADVNDMVVKITSNQTHASIDSEVMLQAFFEKVEGDEDIKGRVSRFNVRWGKASVPTLVEVAKLAELDEFVTEFFGIRKDSADHKLHHFYQMEFGIYSPNLSLSVMPFRGDSFKRSDFTYRPEKGDFERKFSYGAAEEFKRHGGSIRTLDQIEMLDTLNSALRLLPNVGKT